MQFVDGVFEIKSPQQRIRRHLGGAQDIAAAVGFDVRKGQELPKAAIAIAPHPPVDRPHQPLERRTVRHTGHDSPAEVSVDSFADA